MESFVKFLQKCRKNNGEKYLDRTIEIYDFYVELHRSEWKDYEDVNLDKVVEIMNEILFRKPRQNVRSAFKRYLQYLGVPEDSELFERLKVSRSSASALSSARVLSSKVLSRKELKILYDSQDEFWKLVIGFLYDTACREDEMLKVRFKDLSLLKNPSDNMYCRVVLTGKGLKRREVYISRDTYELLCNQFPDFSFDSSERVFVFRKSDGEEYSRPEKFLIDSIAKKSLRILDRRVTVHHFRHSKLTHLADDGADVFGIAKYAGHSDIKTCQIYINHSKYAGELTFKHHSKSIDEG